jgi:hypothetical protein
MMIWIFPLFCVGDNVEGKCLAFRQLLTNFTSPGVYNKAGAFLFAAMIHKHKVQAIFI